MKRRSPRPRVPALFLAAMPAALAAFAMPAQASNDLNTIGFGVQSIGMGGADIPVAESSAAININPAGLTQIGNARFDYTLVPYYIGGGGHGDQFNSRQSPDNKFAGLFNASYAYRVSPSLVLGAGLFVQGGAGYQYKNLHTAFGTRDEYNAIFGVTKLASGLALKLTDSLSVGANVGIAFSQMRQKVFPDTSTPEFSGLRFDGGEGFSANGRVGILYQPTPDLRIGASFMSPTKLKLDDGTVTVNYEAQGLGRVKYKKAKVTGLNLAREAGAGVAWRFRPKWLLAAEVNWLNWSDALKSTTLHASHAKNSAAPPSLELTSPLDHRDQVVYSLGLAIDVTDKTQMLMGWNHTRNAIPQETLSPAFNLTTKDEADLGFIHHISPKWDIGATMQYQFRNDVRYDNPNQPFGPNASERYSLIALDLEITRRW